MEGNREALFRLADDYDAMIWTKEIYRALQENPKRKRGKNQPRCQICGKPATSFFSCSCGEYAWCKDCEGLDPNPKYDDDGTYIGPGDIIWYHADHDCFPACCAHGHPYPPVTGEEMKAILRAQMFLPYNVSFREDRASTDDRVLFSVRVQRKTKEERRYEEEDIRKRFEVVRDDDEELKECRSEKEQSFVNLFVTPRKRNV
jgi:hypothetical protein